jgi:DNA-binding NtrC family response regulator
VAEPSLKELRPPTEDRLCPTAACWRAFTSRKAETSLEEVEHHMVELAMRQANGNQTHAAKLLNISRDALRYKLKKFGLIRGDGEKKVPNPTAMRIW